MRFDLIHGGTWDGWWLVQRDDGQYRLARPLLDVEVAAIRATCSLEDVTPSARRGTGTHTPTQRQAAQARARELGLRILTTEA